MKKILIILVISLFVWGCSKVEDVVLGVSYPTLNMSNTVSPILSKIGEDLCEYESLQISNIKH